MYDLWMLWGDPQVYIELTGGVPVKLTKEEMQGQFELVPTGTIGEQDPQMETQKALARIQLYMQAKSSGLLGDEWQIDLGQALLDWAEKDDVRAAKRILRKSTPEEMQAMQQARQQAMQAQQQQEMQLAAMGSKPSKPTKSSLPQKPQTPPAKPVGAGAPGMGQQMPSTGLASLLGAGK
jgi:hypothetical protein